MRRATARHRALPSFRRGALRRIGAAVVAALIVIGLGVAVPAGAASAAGNGVLTVSMKPTDSKGNPLTTLGSGTGSSGYSVTYLVGYSCTGSDCTGATIDISAPPTDPGGIVPTAVGSPGPNRILQFSTWTPPSGATISVNNNTQAVAITLGTVAAGTSLSFPVTYTVRNNQLLQANDGTGGGQFATLTPAQFYPNGFQIPMTATMDATNEAAPATATSTITWTNSGAPNPALNIPGVGSVKSTTAAPAPVTYQLDFSTGDLSWNSGNATGPAANLAAAGYKVVYTLPAEANYVGETLYSGAADPLAPVWDPTAHTLTWTYGSAASPQYNAAGGWGLPYAPASSWNTGGYYQPRLVNVTYPVADFASDPSAPDGTGCNFADTVTGSMAATVTYLDGTQKTATASVSHLVQCWNPFTQAQNGGKDSTSNATMADGTTRVMWVNPDTTSQTCPASGRDTWGRPCTPGSAPAAFGNTTGSWVVAAYNEANIPGTATIVDDDLTSPTGAPVTSVGTSGGNASIATVAYTLDNGTTGTANGSYTAPSGRYLTAATVTSNPIPAAVTAASNPTNAKTSFVVAFGYSTTPSTAVLDQTWTNTASESMSYAASDLQQPTGQTIDLGTATRGMQFQAMPYSTAFHVGQTAAPVVSGGGNPAPGTNVTFSFTGNAQTLNGGGTAVGGVPAGKDITPEYTFIAPAGWVIPTATSPTFTGAVPDGVQFTYATVTIGGVQRQEVTASWPGSVTFGDTSANWPSMNVVAQPTPAAGGTSAAPLYWISDSRNQFTNTTASFQGATQNTVDVNGDGQTTQYFATTTGTAVTTSGVPSLQVVKSICQPDPSASDGCDWISDPGSMVVVPTDATSIKYKVTLTNSGSAVLSGIVGYDVLPYPGDTGTSAATAGIPRGSSFQEILSSATPGSGVTLQYSTSSNPCRPEVYPSQASCDNTWTGTQTGAQSLKATVASLAVGASASFTYTAAPAGGTLADAVGCNSIAVTSNQTPTSEPQAVCASTQEADLTLSAPAHLPLQAGRGGIIPFTVTNLGGSAGSPATVALDVPSGVTVTGLSPTGYACSDTAGDRAPIAGPVTLTCEAVQADGSTPRQLQIDAPETLALPVTTTAAAGRTVCTTGSVSGPLPDPDESNNDAQSCATVAAGDVAMTVTKSDGVTGVAVGAETTYTITVANDLVAEQVAGATLTDTLPSNLTFVSATGGGTASGQTVTWDLATLAQAGVSNGSGDTPSGGAGSSVSVTVTARVNAGASGSVVNTATASAVDPADAGSTLTASGSDTDTVENVFTDGNASVTTPQNTPVGVPLSSIVTTAGASIDPASVSQATAPAHGRTTIDPATGEVTYVPDPGYSGTDSFTVTTCDTSSPAQCHTSPVAVTVGGNVVTADAKTVDTAAEVAVSVAGSGSSQSGQVLAAPTVAAQPAHGSVTTNADGTFEYTPNAGFSGTDSFTYRLCDTSDPTPVCATATVTVDVANAITGGAHVTTGENTPVTTPLADIAQAAGRPLDPTSVTLVPGGGPAHGEVTIDPTTGAVTYRPDPGYTGQDSYTVNVCDTGSPVACQDETVTVQVLPVVAVAGLALTGSDALPAALAGGGLLVAGAVLAAATAIIRRRKRSA